MQQRVLGALRQLPIELPTAAGMPGWKVRPRQQVVTADGHVKIDIAAETAAGVKLAVGFDGPNDFVSPSNRLNGPAQYRNRALAARRYTVISIPRWEWAWLKGRQARQYYLLHKL